MDNKTTPSHWKQLVESLLFRKAQLQEDLKNEDYSQHQSIIYSKEQQLEAIATLLGQVPSEYRKECR